MSHKRQQIKPQEPKPEEVEFFFIVPPSGQEDVAPSVVSHIDVSGGVDALAINFYYVSDKTIRRAVLGGPYTGNVERNGNTVLVRSEPIARVSLPFSVAMELVVSMVETAIGGVPELQNALAQFSERVTQAIATATTAHSTDDSNADIVTKGDADA